MDVTIVGCSGSFAGPASPASSYLLRAEHSGRSWSVVLDLGSGALGALQRHIDPPAVDAVVVSHLHVDHCIDLCGLYVMLKYGPRGPGRTPSEGMPVWGPAGTAAHLAAAYGNPDVEDVPGVFDFHDVTDRETIVVGPFRITPVLVEHTVEAYGYRVEANGRTLVYTGDTDACDQLVELMTGADLVLADSAFVDGRDDVRGIHLSGSRAARAAVAAGGVSRLMLTHLPAWNDPEVCREQAARVWPGRVELAEPDRTYSL
ncbi:MAG: MBL fold metallo-hydrolase [Humibacillus sp.]|nr:MBL fold metallo-hydrolase [Humibacillus sp.]MDN5778810.1 MBL fold metallo-hydrolase [Humibacillus sp.]